MNIVHRLHNHLRRCLLDSGDSRRQFLTQSIRTVNVLSYKSGGYTNTCPRNDATCKRFYSETVSKLDENYTAQDIREKYQKQFDEFMSTPENKKRFQILELEIDVLRHDAQKVPTVIKPKDWMTVLKTKNKTRRLKFYRFLWRNEKIKENVQAEKAEKQAEWLARKETMQDETPSEDSELIYGLKKNSLFLRIYDTTISHVYNSKLISAMMFEPNIVMDCGYENEMTERETHNCAKQLQLSFAANRRHINPMHLHFCNLKKGGLLEEYMVTNMPSFLQVDFPATVTSQSYLELFPKDQLVYLTPHCKTEMTRYDPDLVYIIGGMVDKSNVQPLSLAKAKREGIRMLKLPIEKYLDWGSSSTKSFTINQVMSIILDLKHTKDWKIALKNVPTRKLRESREHMMRNMVINRQKFLAKKMGVQQPYPEQERPYPERKQSYPLSGTTTVQNFTFTDRKNRTS